MTAATPTRLDPQRLVAQFSTAIHDFTESIPRGLGSVVRFTPRRIVRAVAEDGTLYYVLRDLNEVALVPSSPSAYPARKVKRNLHALDALHSFAAQEEAFTYSDNELWAEALAVAEEYRMTGEQARTLSTALNIGLLARRGCPDVRPWELP